MRVDTSVGDNGFVFALADALKNNLNACGAGGSHLGYSGNNGSPWPMTPISFPKIGIEFDQFRDIGPIEDPDPTVSGRIDPCGIGCGTTYDSHAAIVYWGHEVAGADGVTRPGDDDNVHGFPTVPPGVRPPPRSHADPTNPAETGIQFVNLRDNPVNSSLFHVRVELAPTRTPNADASLSKTTINIQVWIDDDDDGIPSTLTSGEAALKDTTRPMSLLDPTYPPTLTQTVDLFDVPVEPATSCPCPTGACGAGICYRPALEKIQLGFTGSQRTSDQLVNITDLFTTWLP